MPGCGVINFLASSRSKAPDVVISLKRQALGGGLDFEYHGPSSLKNLKVLLINAIEMRPIGQRVPERFMRYPVVDVARREHVY
jgi:hypothetical protein